MIGVQSDFGSRGSDHFRIICCRGAHVQRLLKNSLTVILVTAGTTAIRYMFSPHLGSRVPFLLYVMAVAIASQIAGTISGLAVTGLAIVLIAYPGSPSDRYMQAVLAIFGTVGAVISIFGGWQKRLKDELHLAHERIALKHEIARMGSYEWFVKQNRIDWSPELLELCGLQSHSFRTIDDWISLVHPEDRPQVVAALQKAERVTYDQTYRIIRPDGEIRWLHSRRKYKYDSERNPSHVLGIVIDITELKQGEMAQEILGGLLEVCSACRRIHDSSTEDWYSMEGYLRQHVSAKFSHGMCPDCSRQWYPEAHNGAGQKVQKS